MCHMCVFKLWFTLFLPGEAFETPSPSPSETQAPTEVATPATLATAEDCDGETWVGAAWFASTSFVPHVLTILYHVYIIFKNFMALYQI